MKKAVFLVLALAGAACCPAGEMVTVPWEEIKKLYRESVEREIKEATPEEEVMDLYSIEEALYRIEVGEESATARALLTGKVLSGSPGSILLFEEDVILSGVEEIRGGFLVSEERGICLLPEEGASFQAALVLLAPVKEDGRSKYVAFRTPAALRNSLAIDLPPGHRLLGHPGLGGAGGTFHFSSREKMEIRFEDARGLAAPARIEIDTFTRVSVEGKKVLFTTWFHPVRPVESPFRIRLPEGARFYASSLKGSWIKKGEGNTLDISLPETRTEVFSIDYGSDRDPAVEAFPLSLPVIPDNLGSEGSFAVAEPEDGQVSLEGEGLMTGLPASRLPAGLRSLAKGNESHARLSPGEAARLSFKPFGMIRTRNSTARCALSRTPSPAPSMPNHTTRISEISSDHDGAAFSSFLEITCHVIIKTMAERIIPVRISTSFDSTLSIAK